AQDSLNEAEFLRLLEQSASDLRDAYLRTSPPPAWLATLQEAFDEMDQGGDEVGSFFKDNSLAPYLQPLLPLLKHGLGQLNAGFQSLQRQDALPPFEPQHIAKLLFPSLSEQLLARLSKTFVLEMHIARLQGELRGENTAERFLDFIHQVSQEERILPLLEEYAVLTRQIVLMLDQWIAYTQEFVKHLYADWPQICVLFSPEQDPGLLVEIQSGAGDAHHQGRSVLILTFQSGLRLLYKPRSLALDIHFQQMLTWLNEQGAQPPFRTITFLDQGNYGWSEFVYAQSCTTEDEVKRFFERQGNYLALLYACNAIDMHVENVIAAGEHPILVDLEALFHPQIGENDPTQAFQLGLRSIDNSVFRIGLLPCRIWSSKDASGIDLSGLGGQEGQMTPFAVPRWEASGTDQMHLIRQQVEIPVGQNRPKLNGEDVDVLNYRTQLLQGFTNMYRLLQARRSELITEVLPRFAQDEIRLLFRPTRRYANLLLESFHPELLQDALARDRFFDKLWHEVEVQPHLTRVLPAERRDLLRGDIPFFKTSPESHAIFTSDNEPLGTFFEVSSLELVRQRLQFLDEQDLARQCWIIEAALSTLLVGPERVVGKMLEIKSARQPAHTQSLREAACAVGDRLEALALRNAYGASWLGVSAIGDNTWSLLPTETDLYNGTSGIALFLGYLGILTGEARYTELAKLSLDAVRAQTEPQKKQNQAASLGAFNGLGSALYLYIHMSVLWRDPTLLEEAEKLAGFLPVLIDKDESLDIVGGVAGCILNLLSLHTLHPTEQTLKIARQCGDRLLATAQRMEKGIAWKTIPGEKPLGGFAHGTAGMALSLLKLAHRSGEEHYHQAALDALAYDRSLYLPAEQNWADLRTFTAQLSRARRVKQASPEQLEAPTSMVAWCHGAAGIGLGRVGGLPYLDDTLVRQEIETAIKATIAQGLKDNHSLCHGALGNLDLLVQAVQTLNQSHHRKLLVEATAIVLESISNCGWVAGVPLGVETPGLMTGLA
ncbi:MAG TPA: type 2 lanthipeptide synthetase LanM family protein, partial [Ktedonobacteraceae bacterium]|nr:type 2 lanthipeptide synthetase LanM family protein [Ktedonobacteraceae bacterium]